MSERRKPEIDLKPLSDLTKLIEKSFSENIKPTPPPPIKKPQPRPTR
jgi:hypothetical protein